MAGIGFELKKLFNEDDGVVKTIRSYVFSTLVSVGPWITTIITLNVLLFFATNLFQDINQKELFMGTIIYSFVFSQLLTAPWQILIVRYVSDKLYSKSYSYISASHNGLCRIVLASTFFVSILYYWGKALPLYYKFCAVSLLVVISLIWIIMVYLSAIKNYRIIARAYIAGSIVSVVTAIVLINFPIPFPAYQDATNFLLAYLLGMLTLYGILLFSFVSIFPSRKKDEYDFVSYFKKVPSLFFIGLFYTLGLWIDDIIIWFSPIGINVYKTYKFAPLYDNAVFFAFLTIIPTMVLFTVSFETSFYDVYKKYYGLITGNGTFQQITDAARNLKDVIFSKLLVTMEIQLIITVTLVVVAKNLFAFLNFPLLLTDIFRIVALGAFCNGFVLIVLLVLLYFDARKQALLLSIVFVSSNTIFTLLFLSRGVSYFGVGYFLSSLISLLFGIYLLGTFLQNLTFGTFNQQPLFQKEFNRFQNRFLDFIYALKRQNSEKKKMGKKSIFMIMVLIVVILFLSIRHYSPAHNIKEKRLTATMNVIREDEKMISVGRAVKNWSVKTPKSQMPEFDIQAKLLIKNNKKVAAIYINNQEIMRLHDISSKDILEPYYRAVIIVKRLNRLVEEGVLQSLIMNEIDGLSVWLSGDAWVFTVTDLDAKSHAKGVEALGSEWADRLKNVFKSQ